MCSSRRLFWYVKDFMMFLSVDTQCEIIEPFNSISRYLGDLLTIHNPSFEEMTIQNYPTELLLNKPISIDTENPYYYKRDNFDFDIVNLSYLDGDVPRIVSLLMLFTLLDLFC